ncbi:MAG: PHB depolymerase family esterase [Halofilum sp. (in: g-proteobacteria)]
MATWPGKAVIAIAAATALVAGCAFDRTGPRPQAAAGEGPAPWGESGWYERALQSGEATRWYRLYFPPAAADNAPLVVLLHGGSRSMRDMFGERAGGPRAWVDVADREGVVLVAPNGTDPENGDTRGDNQFWLGAPGAPDTDASERFDDIRFITDLLNRIERRYPIDPERIFVAGASNGGLLTYRLIMEESGRFAAGAAFIANLPAADTDLRPPGTPRPLMIANGTADRVMKWDGGELPMGGGRTRSTEETVAWWLRANHAADAPRRTRYLPDRATDDHCRLREVTWTPEPDGAPVRLLAMEGGGHTLPSERYDLPDNFIARRLFGNVCRDAEGAVLAWEFMREFQRGSE